MVEVDTIVVVLTITLNAGSDVDNAKCAGGRDKEWIALFSTNLLTVVKTKTDVTVFVLVLNPILMGTSLICCKEAVVTSR